MKKTLIKIAKALDSQNIIWGVGASVLLQQYSLVGNPTDIDILITNGDISKADRALSSLGEKMPVNESGIYLTDFFHEYIIDGINVDIMAGFKIKTDNGVYEYIFDRQSVPHSFTIDNYTVPFTTLEDWYILYQLIPQREEKALAIEKYLKQQGITYPHLLHRQAENPTLPDNIRKKIQHLIAN